MEVVGYVAYAGLVILAILWAADVRANLAADKPAILRAVYFVSAAVLVPAFDINMAHSLWLVPFGCLFARMIAPKLIEIPLVSVPFTLAADGFARAVRIGVPRHRIEEARAASLRGGIDTCCNKDESN
jgi:hypothetical protein